MFKKGYLLLHIPTYYLLCQLKEKSRQYLISNETKHWICYQNKTKTKQLYFSTSSSIKQLNRVDITPFSMAQPGLNPDQASSF